VSYVLLDRPNPAGDHFYPTRHRRVKAGVVHITAGLEDLDGVDDHSAERTADYAATTAREVSWHSGSDADSFVLLLPPSYTAWHCRAYSSSTYGHEISKRTTDWETAPPAWVEATLRRAAAGLRPIAAELGIPPRHATRAELDAAIASDGDPVGWIGHAPLDPDRRTDPGGWPAERDTFPWARFLALMGTNEEEDDVDEAGVERAIRRVLKLPETGLALPRGQAHNGNLAVALFERTSDLRGRVDALAAAVRAHDRITGDDEAELLSALAAVEQRITGLVAPPPATG
jgi:hypothetical protein